MDTFLLGPIRAYSPASPISISNRPLSPRLPWRGISPQPINRNHQFLPAVQAAVDPPMTVEELMESPSVCRNPALSSSYRPDAIPVPNRTVLEAQARVCTGPTQTKPLGEEQAFKVFDTILRSARGELKEGEEEVSEAQLGAFFAAMTIRANSFPKPTQWSEGETRAIHAFWPQLIQTLPPEVIFIADPEGSIMGAVSSVGAQFLGQGSAEMRLVGALREVLAGGHLGYEEVQGVMQDVLPLHLAREKSQKVRESLLAAFLIGQRMNIETDRELKAYCLAFDDETGSVPLADVRSLTHYGEPYDGNTRFFRSTLFVAAVRASYGESCLLSGVEWMPPKGGITEEQMLKFMGANTRLSSLQAKTLLEDDGIGFAYLSQRETSPSLYSLIGLREHIKKRPPLATTEKVQQFVRAKGREALVTGFYHAGYEDALLMLMRRRSVRSGLVVKGEEGALSMTTKARSSSASKGLPVNYCAGFRKPSNLATSDFDGILRESFNIEVDAREYGFEPTDTPRTDRSIVRNIELGLAALRGEKGPAYDRIVLNAGMVDHLLDCEGAEDIKVALDRAREAIDSAYKEGDLQPPCIILPLDYTSHVLQTSWLIDRKFILFPESIYNGISIVTVRQMVDAFTYINVTHDTSSTTIYFACF